MFSIDFDFFEAIEIELPDEAFKLGMSEVNWNYFIFHLFLVQNVDHCARLVPADNLGIFGVLRV